MSKRNNRERKPQASREGSFAVGEAGGKQAKAASLKGGKGVSSASKAKNVKKKGPSLLGRLMAFLLSCIHYIGNVSIHLHALLVTAKLNRTETGNLCLFEKPFEHPFLKGCRPFHQTG